VREDTIGTEPRVIHVLAEEVERAALARRFGLEAIARLEAEVSLVRTNHDVVATGWISADVTQTCVATAEPVPALVAEDFAIHFHPQPAPGAPEEEVELGEEELDVVFHDGALVDVGEAVAQTLALNLDPYPRSDGSAEALRAAGILAEAEVELKAEAETGPFGGLAALKDKLSKS
jgi:uncharacterized metal-binding protein YceD (DUF177 family)